MRPVAFLEDRPADADRLAPLLARAPNPIYAVNDDRVIVFANAAAADWLGLAVDDVVGRRVAYHPAPGGAGSDPLLTGLCPPPEALAGRECEGTISCAARSGGLRSRRARNVPLGGGVLVLGDERDLTAEQLAALVAGRSADALHTAIQRFHAGPAATPPATALLGRCAATRKLRDQFAAAAAAGCNALVIGAEPADCRSLAEALHAATGEQRGGRAAPEKPGRVLLPFDLTLIDAGEVVESLAAARRRGAVVTLLLLGLDTLPREAQESLAAEIEKTEGTRLLATASDPGRLAAEAETLVATMTLRVPPLAERRDDLPILFQWFIEQTNAGAEEQISGLTDAALELLAGYPFRDLGQIEAMITAARGACRGPWIDADDLPHAVRQASLAAELSPPRESVDLDTLLADVEREVVARALAVAQGNKAEAARLVGLTRQRFYRLLERLGLLGGDAEDRAS